MGNTLNMTVEYACTKCIVCISLEDLNMSECLGVDLNFPKKNKINKNKKINDDIGCKMCCTTLIKLI